MKVVSAEYVKSCVKFADYPREPLPEIAFAGRSNAGKSSLINSLVERKGLVKVSSMPGKTRLLSWFRVNRRVMFCDLPGYGFANVPHQMRISWGEMIETYLSRREQLRGLVIITDVRRGFEEDDLQLMHAALHLQLHVILVATKCDKLSKNELHRRKLAIARELSVDPDVDIVWYSSESRLGRDALWRRIESLLPDDPEAASAT